MTNKKRSNKTEKVQPQDAQNKGAPADEITVSEVIPQADGGVAELALMKLNTLEVNVDMQHLRESLGEEKFEPEKKPEDRFTRRDMEEALRLVYGSGYQPKNPHYCPNHANVNGKIVPIEEFVKINKPPIHSQLPPIMPPAGHDTENVHHQRQAGGSHHQPALKLSVDFIQSVRSLLHMTATDSNDMNASLRRLGMASTLSAIENEVLEVMNLLVKTELIKKATDIEKKVGKAADIMTSAANRILDQAKTIQSANSALSITNNMITKQISTMERYVASLALKPVVVPSAVHTTCEVALREVARHTFPTMIEAVDPVVDFAVFRGDAEKILSATNQQDEFRDYVIKIRQFHSSEFGAFKQARQAGH